MDPFDALRGNAELKRFLKNEIDAGTLAHAYIFEGGAGTGKHTAALCTASYMARGVPEGAKIMRGLSPDVILVSLPSDRKMIPVESVRAMREKAFIYPNDLPFKAFIIENAEKMNVSAQNAALKILEEPPENTFFFLLCENASVLLPTVRSRAAILRMQRFSEEELSSLLRADPALEGLCAGERYELALRRSGGSYGAAKDALLKDAADDRGAVTSILLAARDPVGLLLQVQKLPRGREEFVRFCAGFLLALRDLLMLRSGDRNGELLFFLNEEEAMRCGKDLTRVELFALCDRVVELRASAERNANVRNLQFGLYGAFKSAR